MTIRRGLLWGFLVAALVLVAAAAGYQRLSRPEPPPVLGRVPDFQLINRDGRKIGLADLAGRPWVADFIFTSCPASCPMMTLRLSAFEQDLPDDLGVHLVSFSVDPEHDTPEVLQRYAESFDAPPRWLFLTGTRDQIYDLSKQGFKLGVDDSPGAAVDGAEPILHSTRFTLVDGAGNIRGYYDAFDKAAVERLRRDLIGLAR
jgi:protein SCO1/2